MNNIRVFLESPRVSEAVSNLKNDIGGIILERGPLHSGEFILREITYTIIPCLHLKSKSNQKYANAMLSP